MPTDSANGAELTVTLDVTNVSATDGAPEFTATATAAETSTGDVECDPSDADNKATVTDSEAVTVANVSAPVVALALAGEGGCLEEGSEEHTSELQSLMRISYAVFCLKKKTKKSTKRMKTKQSHSQTK